jgi:hypothetical protein
VGPTPCRLSCEPATPPDLKESEAHGILPGSLEDAAAALHLGKNYGIRIAGVIPDAGVGSLRTRSFGAMVPPAPPDIYLSDQSPSRVREMIL